MSEQRPVVLVLGTGGTIAGSAAATDSHAYEAGVFSVESLTGAVPGLGDRVELRTRQIFDLDSVDLTLSQRIELARAVQEAVDGEDAPDGIVITHGTDTMEETAYTLHLLVHSDVPVVLTGAMRPADAPGADGPANLADAVIVAASPAARGLGTLVSFGGAVHSAREVSKRHAGRLDAFESLHGPLGHVFGDRFVLNTRPAKAYGALSAFDLDDLPEELPRVEELLTHPETPAGLVQAVLDSGARGIVHAGAGGGNIARAVMPMLDAAVAAGVTVVRATRLGSGPVPRNGAVADDEHGWVAAGDLQPAKARILLSLALTRTSDPREIQDIFDTH